MSNSYTFDALSGRYSLQNAKHEQAKLNTTTYFSYRYYILDSSSGTTMYYSSSGDTNIFFNADYGYAQFSGFSRKYTRSSTYIKGSTLPFSRGRM